MRQTAADTENALLCLLRQWGDALLRLQADLPDVPALDGGILCPACGMIHGRCHEAAYPLLTLAARTGEEAYLTGAKRLLRWAENVTCPDGSLKNDLKSDWRGVTVFGSAALHDALYYHGDLFTKEEKAAQEARLAGMGRWLYANLRPGRLQAYLNYYAANACVMALLGRYFDNGDWIALAAELADFCFSHVSENGLLYGEGHPLDALSPRGCRAIDPGGYNPEETLPMLTRYAAAARDDAARERCLALWRAQLNWMLPDGAWDDSPGTRAFKWTYWGSRTADGCQEALFRLGKTDPVFAEAALRNFELYRRCTRGGLLYGGPDYAENGEKPCVHHTFCHAKTLAGSLNGGLYDFYRTALPLDAPEAVARYPELGAVRLACGGWIADIMSPDRMPMPGAHAAGGAVSLLWHKKTGPVIACGAADLMMKEPLNQQLPSAPERHRSLCPRIEIISGGAVYGQHRDVSASLTVPEKTGGAAVRAEARFCDKNGAPFPAYGECALAYELTENALLIRGSVPPGLAAEARYILPLIGGAEAAVLRGSLQGEPRRIFNLNPGFCALEYTVSPDAAGGFAVRVSVI